MKLEDLKPGMVIKQPGYIVLTEWGTITYVTSPIKNWTVIKEYTLEFTVPEDFNSANMALETISQKLGALDAEYRRNAQILTEQKNKLLKETNTIPKESSHDDLPF